MKKKSQARILLLEDDPALQELLADYYEPRGYQLTRYEDPIVPLKELEESNDPQNMYDLVLTDLRMPKLDGMEFIRRIKKIAPELPIILMTAHSSVEIAINAIDEGAYDFVVKPLHLPQLTVSIERALHLKTLREENHTLRSAMKSARSFEGVVGKSAVIQKVFDLAKRVSNSLATVLITGESGTGKEVVARAIHQHGTRKKGPFVAINCSAIPESLLESELFGHSKGAFTGAAEKKIGLFEEAEGGVLFLDEIGDLNLPLQAKLLRVLQEKKIKRIGENQLRAVDVRILAATHKDLDLEVKEKRFREDLFFRLNVIPIKIPPLRDRQEDIIPLAEYFLSRFRVENDSPVRAFTKASLDHLLKLTWRGNVRELENVVERAVVLCENREIDVKDLPPIEATVHSPSSMENLFSAVSEKTELPSLNEFNLEYIALVLKRVGGVKEQAARILEIDRKTLYRRIEELDQRTSTLSLPEQKVRPLKTATDSGIPMETTSAS